MIPIAKTEQSEVRDEVTIKIKLSPNKIEMINTICESYKNDAGELINVLHEVQHELGYLPAEVQDIIAMNLNVSVAHVYGVVSFYSFFSMMPKGKYPISICLGTACYVRGSEKILNEFKKELNIGVGETTRDGNFSINCLRCVGACGLAPVVMVGERVYGRVSPDGVKVILDEYREKKI